jgi:hypothetical protein
MTAEDLMQVPAAKKYFLTKEEAEEWIKRMTAERQRDVEAGRLVSEVSPFVVRI